MNSISQKIMMLAVCMAGNYFLTQAQTKVSKYELGLSAGTLLYQGDLTPSQLGSFKTMGPQVNIFAQKNLTNAFSLRANLTLGTLRGDDSKYESPAWRQQRNFNFRSPLAEFSALLVWNVIGRESYEGRRVAPYLFGGAGAAFLNITRDWSRFNTAYFYSESGLQPGLAYDTAHSLPKVIPVLPVGIGVRYALTRKLSLVAESSYRHTFTDYLDGFSRAANPEKNDHYYSHSIGLVYRFGGKNMLDCPVIK